MEALLSEYVMSNTPEKVCDKYEIHFISCIHAQKLNTVQIHLVSMYYLQLEGKITALMSGYVRLDGTFAKVF